MALRHIASGEVVALQPLGTALATARSTALLKSQDIELVRVVLPQGRQLVPHAVRGDITLLCLEGEVEVQAQGAITTLAAGQLMYLAGGTPHGLLARSDASLLLTIALRA